ncbi:hypothetical protein [Pseudomonas tohonis]|uniref:hypothetical protein n=1 Tax=Pseudomonas tohonis TaxID=2725477 RepID=UPI001F422B30|nr:hypothetical protein [Pseudomonas tohonis]
MRGVGAIDSGPILTVASAATTDIGAARANTLSISGTTAITALGTAPSGTTRELVFQGALTLTYNATSMILPTGASIVTAANDVAKFVSLGGGNWRCTSYMRADGTPMAAAGLGYAQTWQDMTSSRALSTTYTNLSGKPIAVSIWATSTGVNGNLSAAVGGSTIALGNQAHVAGAVACISFVVPVGATYSVSQGGSAPINKWWELR